MNDCINSTVIRCIFFSSGLFKVFVASIKTRKKKNSFFIIRREKKLYEILLFCVVVVECYNAINVKFHDLLDKFRINAVISLIIIIIIDLLPMTTKTAYLLNGPIAVRIQGVEKIT